MGEHPKVVGGGVEKHTAHDQKEMKGRLVNMPIGKVKWYDAERGFGFISYPEGEDCFVGKSGYSFSTHPARGRWNANTSQKNWAP